MATGTLTMMAIRAALESFDCGVGCVDAVNIIRGAMLHGLCPKFWGTIGKDLFRS